MLYSLIGENIFSTIWDWTHCRNAAIFHWQWNVAAFYFSNFYM